ncbi:uncharacterized protein K02A2.6-like [Ornithodoros turicata]|uniref:uncharacterized protein K02A2.6-like n=1 Tax=Ornithodoros turicata TaxID=34597 RepID=UPI003138B31A
MTRKSTQRAPVQPRSTSTRVFERVHLDFCTKDGTNILVLVDDYSKWLEAVGYDFYYHRQHHRQAANGLRAGTGCQKLVTDNGPQLTSDDFEDFMSAHGIRHVTTPPYHAASNGSTERAVQTVKKDLVNKV